MSRKRRRATNERVQAAYMTARVGRAAASSCEYKEEEFYTQWRQRWKWRRRRRRRRQRRTKGANSFKAARFLPPPSPFLCRARAQIGGFEYPKICIIVRAGDLLTIEVHKHKRARARSHPRLASRRNRHQATPSGSSRRKTPDES